MAFYSLKQRIFMVKTYYQNGNSTEKVQNAFIIEYNDYNKPNYESIAEYVEMFENFGSVMVNSEAHIKFENNSIKLEDDPERYLKDSLDANLKSINPILSPLTYDEVDPSKFSQCGGDAEFSENLVFDVKTETDSAKPEIIHLSNDKMNPRFYEADKNETIFVKTEYDEKQNVDVYTKTENSRVWITLIDKDASLDKVDASKKRKKKYIKKTNKTQCDICKKSVYYLDKHIIASHTTKLYECKECDKKYSLRASLKVHARVHSNDRPFTCDTPGCLKTFKTMGDVTYHKKNHLSNADRPHKCGVCGKGFNKISRLERHCNTHTV